MSLTGMDQGVARQLRSSGGMRDVGVVFVSIIPWKSVLVFAAETDMDL